MTRFEFLAVLRSIKKVTKLGTKDDVEELLDDMIADAEGSSIKNRDAKE